MISDEEDSNDGPFLKMYKKHMRWKEATKNLAVEEQPSDSVDRQDWLRSVVFKDYLNFDPKPGDPTAKRDDDDDLIMQLSKFKKRMQKRLADSPNRFDQQAARRTSGEKYQR